MLGRALREARATVPFRLVSLAGGKSRNAIPRDASRSAPSRPTASSGVPDALEPPRRDDPRRVREDRRGRHGRRRAAATRRAIRGRTKATAALLDAIALVPTGPLALSPDFDDLVETSTSLGEAITEGDELTLHSLSRSSNDSALPEVIATLDAAARLGGGALEVKHNYGGWRPDLDSKALAAAQDGLRAGVRRAADHHRGARRARDGRDRTEGRPASTCSRSGRRSSSRTRPTSA